MLHTPAVNPLETDIVAIVAARNAVSASPATVYVDEGQTVGLELVNARTGSGLWTYEPGKSPYYQQAGDGLRVSMPALLVRIRRRVAMPLNNRGNEYTLQLAYVVPTPVDFTGIRETQARAASYIATLVQDLVATAPYNSRFGLPSGNRPPVAIETFHSSGPLNECGAELRVVLIGPHGLQPSR